MLVDEGGCYNKGDQIIIRMGCLTELENSTSGLLIEMKKEAKEDMSFFLCITCITL
jgi:hypothetical protein